MPGRKAATKFYGAAATPVNDRTPTARSSARAAGHPSRAPVATLQVDDRAGEGAGDALDRLDPGDDELAELVDVACLGTGDHVVRAGDALGDLHALDRADGLGDRARPADLGLDEDVCRQRHPGPPRARPPPPLPSEDRPRRAVPGPLSPHRSAAATRHCRQNRTTPQIRRVLAARPGGERVARRTPARPPCGAVVVSTSVAGAASARPRS